MSCGFKGSTKAAEALNVLFRHSAQLTNMTATLYRHTVVSFTAAREKKQLYAEAAQRGGDAVSVSNYTDKYIAAERLLAEAFNVFSALGTGRRPVRCYHCAVNKSVS